MSQVLDIPWWRLALVFVCLAALVGVLRQQRSPLARPLAIASLRGPAQLLAIGYVLAAIFAVRRAELVLVTLLIMLAVATHTAVGRLSVRLPGLHWLTAGALAAGTGLGLVMMSGWIVRPDPWFAPQYLIPFGGMVLGNAMNGASLAGERFQEDMRSHQAEIETRLALGFGGAAAVQPLVTRALGTALTPIVNSFTTAGIVQLPGMMTGQILGGTNPVVAVKYQILIFVLILLAVTVTTLLFLRMLRSRYLTPAHQLRRHLLR